MSLRNVSNGSNLAVYCFLADLEEKLFREGRLPDTIFHQIDGGSENTAKMMLGV